LNTAPYHVIVTVININNEEQMALGEKLYGELQDLGIEVLLDDRKERAGFKFKDRDLIGIPMRITVGKKAPESIVEYSLRSDNKKQKFDIDQVKDIILEEFKKNNIKI